MSNGVVFFKVLKIQDAIIKVQNYEYAISQYAQTALRDVIGGMTLDTLLAERQHVGDEIRKIVDKETDQWGLDVQGNQNFRMLKFLDDLSPIGLFPCLQFSYLITYIAVFQQAAYQVFIPPMTSLNAVCAYCEIAYS